MGSFYYDLHIHSCLSPCGDDDMTPGNIVGMARLIGQDIIALTDHNSCRNCPAAAALAEDAGLVFVPGMELTTSEDAHVICLLPDMDSAMAFDEFIESKTHFLRHKPEKMGQQQIMDKNDNLIGTIDRSLFMATQISIDDVPKIIADFGGVSFPAHINRPSFSVTSVLGVFPDWAGYKAVEIASAASLFEQVSRWPEIAPLIKLRSSDAHYLEDMGEKFGWIALAERSAKALIDALKSGIAVTGED